MKELTPYQIVSALDRHIVGQNNAKRAVAIAIRNRWRRQQLSDEMREEVMPKNIILIGPTGVGKTEIARRVAQLVKAPFIKVEASKYTEVGYHGRDVESMIRDLVDMSVNLVKSEQLKDVQGKAATAAEESLLDLLVPQAAESTDEDRERREKTRDVFRRKLAAGDLDDKDVEVDVADSKSTPMVDVFSNSGVEQFGFDLSSVFNKLNPQTPTRRRMPVSEARRVLVTQEAEKLVDEDRVNHEGLRRAEDSGIIFLDEIDKIISTGSHSSGEVSREGVQRDLLPIVEGSTVMTRYGMVRTDHILFIGAGAFHGARPTALIPELQGRFPIRVELSPLGQEEFVAILQEPENALPRQYSALLSTEGVGVKFTSDGLGRIAEIAWELNDRTQNIGARRLYALFEKLLETPLFDAPDSLKKGHKIKVDKDFVDERLGDLLADSEQASYIL